jgi:hypothetical protein
MDRSVIMVKYTDLLDAQTAHYPADLACQPLPRLQSAAGRHTHGQRRARTTARTDVHLRATLLP